MATLSSCDEILGFAVIVIRKMRSSREVIFDLTKFSSILQLTLTNVRLSTETFSATLCANINPADYALSLSFTFKSFCFLSEKVSLFDEKSNSCYHRRLNFPATPLREADVHISVGFGTTDLDQTRFLFCIVSLHVLRNGVTTKLINTFSNCVLEYLTFSCPDIVHIPE